MRIDFDNSYAKLPTQFFARQNPDEVPAPELIFANAPLAERLGLDPAILTGADAAEVFAGNRLPEGADPLAMAYAGHQFGNWVPRLGDGRAILLGEVVAPDGVRFDLHLKGAGRTPFSRGGDGKAAIGPVLREYLISEAMAALGIPTTRSLAATLTGEAVYRETPQPGAVLTRVARSHIRVGTFQYFYARQDHDALRALLDHVVARHYPEAATAQLPALAMLRAVMARQADLVAQWMSVGFIHGVMNTDNMAISGETIDFGPCAFMDQFDPATVYSSIDRHGRYAWANQPGIVHWNLAQLAQSLLPLIAENPDDAVRQATEVIDDVPTLVQAAYQQRFGAKLGFSVAGQVEMTLLEQLLTAMQTAGADFTLSFRHLTKGLKTGDFSKFDALFGTQDMTGWRGAWQERLPSDAPMVMAGANPVFIPRNHRVDAALKAAETGDLAPFKTLQTILARPFEEQPDHAEYEAPPEPHEVIEATFCGT